MGFRVITPHFYDTSARRGNAHAPERRSRLTRQSLPGSLESMLVEMSAQIRDKADLRLLGLLPLIIFGSEFVAMLILEAGPPLGPIAAALADAAILTAICVPSIGWLVVAPLRRALAAERAETVRREAGIRKMADEQASEAMLARAMGMAEAEADVLDLVRRALAERHPHRAAELLVADSSFAHLRKSVEVGPGGRGPGCDVATPGRCPAVRGGQSIPYPDSDALDACPHLRNREGGACSATCVPVSIMGRAVGVLHTTGPHQTSIPEDELRALEVLATQTGARLGMLRAVETAQLQANTDGLTGLLNRRSFEARTTVRLREGGPISLVLCDLDHFKRLNDTHGHDAGDRALRLFARVLQQTVRAGDLVGRIGGEEIAVLMPGCRPESAAEVMDRLRLALANATARSNCPPFTVSCGIADGAVADDYEGLFTTADRALYQAKAAGRDRVVIHGVSPAVVGPTAALELVS
jgi:diguanylate cyclase (GGDEF)-like protein